MKRQQVHAFLVELEALSREHGIILCSKETVHLEEMTDGTRDSTYGYLVDYAPKFDPPWDYVEWVPLYGKAAQVPSGTAHTTHSHQKQVDELCDKHKTFPCRKCGTKHYNGCECAFCKELP